MKLLGLEIVGRSKTNPSRRSNAFDESYWSSLEDGAGPRAISGARVTAQTAMKVAAVNSAVAVISRTISSLPLILYRKDASGNKERAVDHPFYNKLQSTPNAWMTRFEWVEKMMRDLLLRGNAYSEITGSGKNINFIPLSADKMKVGWAGDKTKFLVYEYTDNNKTRKFLDNNQQIIHWRGPSDDGVLGKSPIQEAQDVIGNALALDNYQSFFYANGVRNSGVLEHPGQLDEAGASRLSTSFRDAYGGAANSGKVVVLEEGMKFNNTSITPKDADFIASHDLSVRDIARIFCIPPHMIGDLKEATFSNIEQQAISFVVNTIRPWTVRIELALAKTLLTEEESKEYYIEFLLDALLRGDLKSRYEAYQIGIQNSILKVNEARQKENLNDLEWGDMTLVPLNMKPITSSKDLTAPAPAIDEPVKQEDEPVKKSLDLNMVTRLTNDYEELLNKAVATFTKRENEIFNSAFKSSADFEKKLDSHESFITKCLTPIVVPYANQLRLLADIYSQESAAIDTNFITDFAKDYVDGWRRSTILTGAGEPMAINSDWEQSKEKIESLLGTIRSLVFINKGEQIK